MAFEKIWDHERQRRNRKPERAKSAPGASLRDKLVSADLAVQPIFKNGWMDWHIQ